MGNVTIKIPSELFALAESSRFEGKLDIPVLQVGPDDYHFDEPVSWYADITNTGAALYVSGRVTGKGSCCCARCLEDVDFDFQGDIEGYFLITGHVADESEFDEDAGDDEFDVLPEDHVIDMEPLIKAALIVDAPYQPLCSDTCKGLCPQCGANLNEGDCGCGVDPELAAFEEQSNPFAVLSQLHFDD